MKKILYSLIAILALCYAPKTMAQSYNMSNLGTISGACGGNFYDSGGPAGTYANGENYTATFCAPAGQYITFTFSSFNVENSFEHLIIYNGPTVGSPMIGNYTGTNSPGTVTSTLGGCLTFTFTSDGSITNPGWAAAISCSTTPPPPPPPTPGSCGTAQPFCTATGVSYPASTGTTAPAGPNYGCLFTQPNPAWYYLNVATSGAINIDLSNSASVDIDFICWGPFASQAAMCTAIFGGAVGIDCSYSTAATEQVNIPSAVAGEWYMLLVTNYANVPTNITAATGAGSTGTTNCAILCNMTGLTAVPGACAPATGQYSVTGQVTLSYPPTTGNLTISSSCGGSVVLLPPWTSPISYTLPGITATGGACNITATFSSDPTCTMTVPYTSPAPCNTCSITAGNSGPICAGGTYGLTASNVAGATYAWTSSSGYSSSTQNPTGIAAPAAGTYTYTVTATVGATTCTAVTTLTVNPQPTVVAEPAQTYCAGAAVPANTFASTPAGATFTWTNSNTAIGLAASGTTSVPAFTATNATGAAITATITITPTLGTCVGPTSTYVITVNPIPVSTFTQSPNQCLATNSFNFTNTGSSGAGYTYSWNFGGGGAAPATSTTNNQTGVVYTTPGTYTVTHTITSPAGCTSTTTSTVTIYPQPVVTVNDPTICAGATTTLTAGGASTYVWSAGATTTGVTTASVTPGPTSYTVTGTDGNGCTDTDVATVTVNPLPTVTAEPNLTFCAGDAVPANTFNSTPIGATFTWTNSNTAIGLAASGTTSTPGFTAVNGTAAPITATISITPTLAGCVGPAITYTITVNPLPTVVAEANQTYCPGAAVPANTFVSNPAGGTFTWTNSNTAIGLGASGTTSTPAFTAANATGGAITGTVTITPTLAGCVGTPSTYTITVNPTPPVAVTSATICPGGTATLTASGASTYTWSAGATPTGVTTATASPATTTSYTVTGTSAAGCTATAVATVTVSSALAITVNSPTICAGATATLTAGGGTTYTWSAGATSTGVNTASATPAITTTYTVTGTTAGCSNTAVATVTVTPLPTVVSEPNLTFCAGAAVPANTFASTPAGATFTWTNSNTAIGLAASGTTSTPGFTATNATASPITATITITPTSGTCVGPTSTYTITVNPLPITTVTSATICPGGIATLTAGGASTYVWSAGVTVTGVTTATAAPATTTSYTVTGTSAAGCTSTAVATVTVAAALTVTVNSPTICNGSVATLTAGGAATYAWSAGASSTGVNTASASPTSTTSYTVTGTSAGCTGTAVATVTVNAIPTVTVNSPTICAGATATLTAGGATTYTWSAGATSTGVNTATATPATTTTYTVTGTTAGCSNTAVATVTVNPIPVVTVNSPTICAGTTAALTATGAATYAWSAGAVSTGVATANATPATTTSYTVTGTLSGCTATAVATVTVTPLPVVTVNSVTICAGQTANLTAGGATTYTWSGGASSTGVNTATAAPATTTTYTVTGTTSGCTATAVSTVTVNPLPVVTVNSPTICTGATAALTAGGASTYVWSAGATSTGVNTADATPATTTSYTVTGTTAGCTGSAVTTVTVNPLPVVSVNSPTVCPGQTATLTAAGAATYTWSAGATSTGVNTATASPGATTSYTVTGTSAGCTGTAVATVTIGGSISVTVNSPTICPGGTATLTATGGATYVWSAGATPTGVSTATASPGATTSYTVTGTMGGCTGSAVATVTVSGAIAITVNSPTICNGQTANLTATGATTYVWSAGASSTGVNTADATPATTTSYTVTGTTGACTGTGVATVTVTPLPTVTVTSPTICIGTSATLTAGGATTYTWSAGATSTGATTATASPVTTTTYTVTGTASGCTNTAISTVTVTPLPVVTVNSPTICAGQTATLTGLGATTYTWSAGATSTGVNTADASPLTTTSYTVTGTATGCSNTAVATVTVNPLPIVTVNSPTICNGQVASLTASGASTYTWSAGASSTGVNTADATPATTTSYTVTGTSAAGCTGTAIATVTVTPIPNVTVTSPTICIGATATMTAGGATTYVWSAGATPSGATTATASPATTTSYTVTGTASGCSSTAVATVTVNPLPIVTVNSPSICPGSTATLTANGATTYAWTAGAVPAGVNTATASPATTTSYTVTGTLLGCTSTAVATVSINSALTVDAGPNDTICFGQSTPLTVTPNGAGYTYSWSPAAGLSATNIFNPSANPTTTTTYVVVVTDINGCTGNDNVTIYSDPQINPVVSGTNITCNSACNGSTTVATTGGSNAYTYLWSNAATTATAGSLCPGTYSVTVTDSWGCTATGSTSITQPALLTSSVTASTPVLCNGACNGTATAAGAGGTGAFTYSWNTTPVQTTATATAMCAGTYTVTVSDANNCTSTSTITINQPFALTAAITAQTNVNCFGTSTGSVTVAGSGGTPTYQYSINAGTTYFPSGTFTGLAAGSYTILVRDANNCTVAQAVTITAPAAITSSVSGVTAVTCFGGNDGALTVTGAGGTPTFQYSINGGTTYQSSGTFTGLTAGPYTVILQDGNGCTFTQPVTITQPTQVTVTATKVDATCGAANGSLTATGANGTPGYTYSIGGAFQVSGLFTGLAPATYMVTVKDANGCTGTTTISVVDLSGLTASITAQTNVSCNGGTNGSVTVTAGGSTAPYLYSINGGALGGSGTFTGLAQGSYTVVAQDGNGCTVSVPVIITQPTVLTGNISAQTNITCNGLSNGSVTIAAAGGTTAYSYSLDGGAFVPGATFTGMTVGAHTITVQDANGCTVAVPITITQPTALAIVLTTVNATCTAANGSATATPAGATPAYSYLWSPGGATTPTNNAITAGNYTVTVTDANGCTLSGTTSVGQAPGGPAVISSSTNVTCAAAADGTATVSMGAGSTPPFSYAWSPSGQTTVTATNLGPASYTVTVTDGNGCISTASVVITQPTALSQTFTNTNVSCFGGTDGIITINPAGGTPGYSYLWTPGSYTTATITPIAAGTYTVTYTDANGCSATASTAITQPAGMTLSSTQVDATCNLANGSATVTVGGGTGPYTFLWSDAAAQTTATATGLPSNTYVCTVTDANGCTQTHSVTINNLAGPVATVFSSTNVSCFGLSDGAATVTVSGGTIPFTFAWNNGQTLPTATNLVAGTYTLVATDASGCIASTSVTITEPLLLDLAITGSNPSCFGSCDGSMTSNTFGGTAPYVYLWNPGGITTPTASSLCAGTYTLQVTDANGCTAFKPATLTAPPAVTATTTTTNISCSGLCNGTATANPMTGTGPYTYLWSDINAQTTQTATGLCAGTYTVTVTDAGGCTATVTATITTPASMIASITTIGNVTCAGACDGFATATVTGGSAPYAYLWNPTSTAGASVNNMCADNYTVTVTDANGCTASTTANITEPFPLVATITSTNVTCFGACDATANAVYTGGTGPYTFQWTPTFATTPNIASVCAGVHNLSVTDGNGCIATASVVITEPTILAVTTTTTNSSCGNADGSACAAITGGVPPFSYSWNDPSNQTTNCANNINAGVYTISITDGNGCSVTGLANVNDNTAPVVTIPTSANVTCAGAANGSAQSSAVGGIIPYTIAWTPTGQTTAFISGLSGGIYSVTYTDSIGCVGSATVTINEPAPLVSGILATSNVSCFLTCDGTATVGAGGGTTPYTYLWNTTPVQTTATATGLCAAGYTVTITDANGCVSTSTTTITTPTAISLSVISTTNVSCNGGSNGAINIDASGGSPGYTYTWTPNVGSGPMVTGLVAGTYTVTVTDQNGCSSTITATVTEPTAIALSTISNPSTCGNNNGFVSVTPTGGTPGYTYLWTDPTSQTTAIATSLFAGTYTVTVTDSHGCTADTSVVLLDHAGPTLDPFTTTPPLCNGTALGTATVFPVGGQPLYSYLWSGIGAQTTQTASALVAGTYTVTVTDANGCTVVGSVTVVEPAPTNLFVSPPDTICVGQNAIIYGAGYGGTPTYTYTWIAPAAFTGAGPHVVNPTVTTTYDLFVTDANGCVSPTQTITLYVHPPLSVTATDATVCSGSFVTISAVAGGGNGGPYTYTWSNAVSGSSQSVSPPIGSSPYDYIVIADDGCSLLATDTATITVNPLPVSFMLASDTAGCEDFTVTFNGVSDIGTSYSWNFGDGSAPVTGEPVTHTYPAIGGVLTQYDVTLTVTSALGCSASVQVLDYIDVYPGPTAEFSYSPTTITQTSPLVDFTDLSTGGPVAWQWFFDNPNTLYTDVVQNPSYFYQNPGQYEVMLVVTNSFGCVDTAWHNLEVVPEYTLYVPNAFTPFNHDGVNDTFFPQGVGIDKDNFTFMIFDRWGNMIFKTNDPTKGWDGHANGGDKVAQIDTYVWKIDTQDFQGNPKQYVGTVTIVK